MRLSVARRVYNGSGFQRKNALLIVASAQRNGFVFVLQNDRNIQIRSVRVQAMPRSHAATWVCKQVAILAQESAENEAGNFAA